MRIIKRILTTLLYAALSKFASAQVNLPDTIYMYTDYEKLYLDSAYYSKIDTLFAINDSGRFEENALKLINNEKDELYDILSMCCNKSTPTKIKLIRIGTDVFRIEDRIIVKIDKRTLERFAKSFEYPRHCDHASHASHVSHYSAEHLSHSSHVSHYSSRF